MYVKYMCVYHLTNVYIYLEPKWPLLVGKDLVLGGLTFKNRGRIGVPGVYRYVLTQYHSFVRLFSPFFSNGTDSPSKSCDLYKLKSRCNTWACPRAWPSVGFGSSTFPPKREGFVFFLGGGGGWCNETALAKGRVYFWSKYRCSGAILYMLNFAGRCIVLRAALNAVSFSPPAVF